MHRALTAIILLLLVVPSAASAQQCVGPPGQGAIDQYCELVPTGAGPRGEKRTRSRELPAATRRALRRAGPDGQAVQLLAQDSPAPARGGDEQRGADQADSGGAPAGATEPPPRPVAEAAASSSLADAARSGVSNAGAAGGWLPWLLLASALAAGVAAGWRRRGRS